MNDQDSRIIDVLLVLATTVNWLSQVEPVNVSDIPPEHLRAVKQLEALGLVYRRNARTCALQRHRLIKMLKRESQYATTEKQEQCMASFAMILAVEDDQHKSLSSEVERSAAGI